MSIFQFTSNQGVLPVNTRIADGSATVIVSGATNTIIVPWFEINQTADTALNLTVDIYDGSAATYLGCNGSTWNAKAISGKAHLVFDEGYVIPIGSTLRVTSSSSSGLLHVVGTQIIVNG